METCCHLSNMLVHQEVKALRDHINERMRGGPLGTKWNDAN